MPPLLLPAETGNVSRALPNCANASHLKLQNLVQLEKLIETCM